MDEYNFDRMSDEELLRREREQRNHAHNAPRSAPGAESNAFAIAAARYAELAVERKRRGLAALSKAQGHNAIGACTAGETE